MLTRIANEAWAIASWRGARQFDRALRRPETAQRERLRSYLARNEASRFGREHRFASIRSVAEFRRAVPLSTFDDFREAVEEVRASGTSPLTAEPVLRLVPTSGSTGRKLIPLTRSLLSEFQRGIGPWIVDTFRRRPRLKAGPAYWSISPATPSPTEASAVPVGFGTDEEYLGSRLSGLVAAVLAVPPDVARIEHIESFRYATLLHLLRARDLTLISVWHPSFLVLLLDALREAWPHLLEDIDRGGVRLPEPISGRGGPRLMKRLVPQPARARELAELCPDDIERIWPHLGLVSCWADAHAVSAVTDLKLRLGDIPVQPKGLAATEAFVSLPYAGARPLAVRSHFFEFLDDAGTTRLAHELQVGGEYRVVVTTGGGLWRYQLQDRVRVDGRLGDTPTIAFLGKEDQVCDRFGEKLSDAFVASVIASVLAGAGVTPRFALLAPEGGPRSGTTRSSSKPVRIRPALRRPSTHTSPQTRTTHTAAGSGSSRSRGYSPLRAVATRHTSVVSSNEESCSGISSRLGCHPSTAGPPGSTVSICPARGDSARCAGVNRRRVARRAWWSTRSPLTDPSPSHVRRTDANAASSTHSAEHLLHPPDRLALGR